MADQKSWTVKVHRDAEKILKKLDRETFNRIRADINQLAKDPKPVGYKKLSGADNLYCLRVGDWKITYALEKDQLIILVVETSPRGDAYRKC